MATSQLFEASGEARAHPAKPIEVWRLLRIVDVVLVEVEGG